MNARLFMRSFEKRVQVATRLGLRVLLRRGTVFILSIERESSVDPAAGKWSRRSLRVWEIDCAEMQDVFSAQFSNSTTIALTANLLLSEVHTCTLLN